MGLVSKSFPWEWKFKKNSAEIHTPENAFAENLIFYSQSELCWFSQCMKTKLYANNSFMHKLHYVVLHEVVGYKHEHKM